MADAATVVVAARQNALASDLANNSESTFQMDRAYHLNTVEVEQQLFDELVQPIVDRVLAGFNGTVQPRSTCAWRGRSNACRAPVLTKSSRRCPNGRLQGCCPCTDALFAHEAMHSHEALSAVS